MSTLRRGGLMMGAWLIVGLMAVSAALAAEDPFRPLGQRREQLRKGNAYSITHAEEALPLDQLPPMVKGHPRLWMRPTAWEHGLSLAQVRERAKQEPWAGLVEWIQGRGGEVTARQLADGKRGPWWKDSAAAEAVLNALAEAGLGAWDAPASTGGRPKRVFRLAPKEETGSGCEADD